MFNGAHVVTLPKFDPKLFVSSLSKNKISIFHTVPALLQFITQSPAITPEHLSNTRGVTCGAAPVHTALAEGLKKKANKELIFQEVYGMTESGCTHVTPVNDGVLGSCGRLLSNASARIISLETGEDLPAGEEGELLLK